MLGVAGGGVEVATPEGKTGVLPRSAVDVYGSVAAIPVPTGDELVATARRFLGVRYLWGGIPRDADAQALAGRPVARDALAPGDLVFFATDPPSPTISHVGMYIGDGQMIEAPNSASAVHVVPVTAFAREYVTARRYVPAG